MDEVVTYRIAVVMFLDHTRTGATLPPTFVTLGLQNSHKLLSVVLLVIVALAKRS